MRIPMGILILGLLVAGCASGPATSMFLDPTFTDASIDEGGLIVLGAVSLADEDARATRDLRSREFEELAREYLGCLSKTTRGDAWILLDIDETHRVLDDYRNTGRLGPEQMATLAPLASRARYVLLARFDLDRVTYDYRRDQRDEGDRVVITLEPESKREMGALFDVFDLQRGQLVWSTAIQRVDLERGRLYEVESFEALPTQTEYHAAVQEVTVGSSRADAPDPVRARRELFRKVLKGIPGSKKKD